MRSFYGWLRGHPLVVDSMLALLLMALGLSVGGGALVRVGLPRVFLFMAAMSVPVVLRRRYPVGAFVLVVVVGGLEVLALPRPVGSDLAVIVLLYTLAACRPRRVSLTGLAVCLAGSAAAIAKWAPEHAIHSLYTLGATAAVFAGPALLAWLLGDSMQWRRGYYRGLEERAARLERERDAQAQIAAAAERARIARELHDVVAHNVSVMVVQADGATFALETSPEKARQALTAISRTGRQALAEMRSMLGVLRSAGDEGADLEPQPGVEQLAGLLEQTRAAGLPVSFAVQGVPRPLPPGAALTAYRIVQESLTNARKHGGPAVTAAVTLRFCEDQVVVKAADGLDAVALAARGEADVMVMDVRMPRLDGVQAARRICAGGERPKVLMLTTFDLDEYAFAALKAGASGFLLKDVPPHELLFAIRAVHSGDSVVAPSTTRRLIDRFVPLLTDSGDAAPAAGRLAELTEREREVLVQVAAGLSNAEIATRLFVSEATVKTHVGRILAKLGLRDRVQAVVLAYESGLVRARTRP